MSARPKSRRRVLSARARSFDGAEFDPRRDLWRFRSGLQVVNIDFGALQGCAPELAEAFRRLILWYVQNRSVSLASGIYNRFLHFTRFQGDGISIAEITAQQILDYRSSLPESQRWYVTTLAGAFRRWRAFELPGISSDTQQLLKKLKLKGNRKGEAVRTACPISGPLSDIKFSGIVSSINSAFREGSISRSDYLLVFLCVTLGLRPVQLSALKTVDFLSSNEGETAILRVPRAKQPEQGYRETFKERPLANLLVEQFILHVGEVQARFQRSLIPTSYPMFPAAKQSDQAWAVGLEWHLTPRAIYARVRSALEAVGVHSERTGLPLRLNPIRLRRTVGTRAAAQGHGVMVIAEMLDHSDLQNAAVYVEARPDIIDRIDEALAISLAPLAQAFVGDLEGDHSTGDAPGGKIVDPRFGRSSPLGRCGTAGQCRLAAPTGCYTCPSFRAWRHGPHREVLGHLVRERARLKELGSERVAAANDRAILAVAQVVQLCEGASDG